MYAILYTMHENHLYNLLAQQTEEHKSLWRILNEYKKDAEGCPTCQAFWEKLGADKKAHTEELHRLIKEHLAP